MAGVGWPVWRAGHRETWAVGVTYLAMDPFDVVSENTTVGTAQISDGVATLSYARPMGPIHFGLSTKLIRQDLDVVSGQTYAVDMGLLGQSSSERLSWGLTAANMGPAMTIGNQEIGLPFVFRAGMSALLARSRRAQWLVSLQADAPIDDSVQGHAGVEYRTALGNNWNAALRGGLQTQEAQGRWAVGASLERGPLALHYTFSENADLGVVNRFEFALTFGAPLAQEVERDALMAKTGAALAAGESTVAQETLDRLKALTPSYRPAEKLRESLRAAQWETLDPSTLFNQGSRAWEAGDPETAAVFFRKLLVVQPDHIEGAKALEKAEKDMASRRLEQTRREVDKERERRIKAVIDQARENMKTQRWDNAMPRWREALALDKDNAEAREGLAHSRRAIYNEAVAAQSTGDADSARRLFLTLHDAGGPLDDSSKRLETLDATQRERARQRSAAAYQEGRESYKQGDLTNARTLFQEALKGQPNDKAIQRALERVEEELNRKGAP